MHERAELRDEEGFAIALLDQRLLLRGVVTLPPRPVTFLVVIVQELL
jgi:hypothetical protein